MGEIPNGLHRSTEEEQRRLGAECKRLRDEYSLTYTVIARRKGVSINSVRKWISKVG